MRITVTPICRHPDGWRDSGVPYEGRHAIISSEYVILDGVEVIARDRRMKKNREPGHNWVTEGGGPWTSFHVSVEP